MEKQLPVSVWPEWEIVEKIGEGSFGKVYKARRTEQGKTFYSAIKVICKGIFLQPCEGLHTGSQHHGILQRKFSCCGGRRL